MSDAQEATGDQQSERPALIWQADCFGKGFDLGEHGVGPDGVGLLTPGPHHLESDAGPNHGVADAVSPHARATDVVDELIPEIGCRGGASRRSR